MAASVRFALPHVECVQRGVPNTLTWRLFLQSSVSKALLSPWHHLPLRPSRPVGCGTSLDATVFTYVNEIPCATRAKLEMATKEPYNPIAHDFHSKLPDKPLRYFKYGDSPFNYGFLPRTWECPEKTKCPSLAEPAAGVAHGGTHVKPATHQTECAHKGATAAAAEFRGDGDPLDVVLLGPSCAPGSVHAIRVLGVLGLIDQGELDWKVIAESYPMHEAAADKATCFGTLAKVPTSLQDTIVDWFRNYKTAEGKKQNEFIFDARIMDVDTALEVIDGCAAEYDALLAGQHVNDGYWLPTS